MKFYDCTTAPSPRRVRIYLAEKGVDVDTCQVDLRNGEQFSDSFRAINPDCTVPVLVLDDGTVLSEVFAICQYLEEMHPEPPVLGRDATERALVTMWNAKIEQQGLGAIAEVFRNKSKGFKGRALTGAQGFEQVPALAERGMTRLLQFYDRLDSHLGKNKFVAGDSFTLADVTAFVATEFAGRLKLEIGEERLNLSRWFDEIKQRPASNN
jgi:glutathione S-transferase